MNSTPQPRRVLQVLEAALQADHDERLALLEGLSPEERGLRREVERLLALEEEADRFLAEPLVQPVAEPLVQPMARADQGPQLLRQDGAAEHLVDGHFASDLAPPDPPWNEGRESSLAPFRESPPQSVPSVEAPARIGPYRLLEVLGHGGMGSVYRARREDDFEKQVAIKLVQHGLATEATVRRFHLERQILARLEHPNIARLLDGGTAADGRPYLVMELVEGEPIDAYCEQRQPSLRARLELVLSVCSALAFAHRNLVVHRDLKPSNILVTRGGVPKLLDFGIAKLIDPGAEHLTRSAGAPMTLCYASPEQVRGQLVTTASDVYGLGLLLYLLLTGTLPCGLSACTLEQVASRILEREPRPPSQARLIRQAQSPSQAQSPRQAQSSRQAQSPSQAPPTGPEQARPLRSWWRGKLRQGPAELGRRELAGDVDAMVLKALRKEPNRRYASVDQLADDLRRYLSGRPVLARRGSHLYRAGKLLRRNRRRLLLVAILALPVAGWLWSGQRRRAEVEQRRERVVAVMRELISVADPDARGGEELSPGLLLERARGLLPQLGEDSELRSELLATLGRLYHRLGELGAAQDLAAESLEEWRRLHPQDSTGLAVRLGNLGAMHLAGGDYGAAEDRFREAVAMYERLGLGGSEPSALHLANLGTVLLYRGRFDASQQQYERSLELRQALWGEEDPRLSTPLRSLGALHFARGDEAAAESTLRRALALRLAHHGPEHTAVASVQDLLGSVRLARGDALEAERLFRRALEIRRQRLGSNHPQVARSERNLAELLLAEGNLETTRLLLARSQAKLLRALGPNSPLLADGDSLLGSLYARLGRGDDAEICLRSAYERLRASSGEHALRTREAKRRLHIHLEEGLSAAGS